MPSKYGIGQDAQWLTTNFHLILGHLDDGEWTWTDHPLPHKAKCKLRACGLLEQTQDDTWVVSPNLVKAAKIMARERGYEEDAVFVDGVIEAHA